MNMTDIPGKILLVTPQFCPKGGIGTRRWSKFAKYLARDYNMQVHILTVRYPFVDAVNWCHDLENLPNLIIHKTPGGYPSFLLRQKRNAFIKAAERFLTRTIYPLDKFQRWGPIMARKANAIISKYQINHLIITGPPFSPLPAISTIKNKHPRVNIFVDYRDPWIFWVEKQNGQHSALASQVDQLEKSIFHSADQLWVTTPEIKRMYSDRFPDHAHLFRILPNAFDPDDAPTEVPIPEKRPFHFIYPGTMLPNRSIILELITKAVKELDDPFFPDNMQIHIYSSRYFPPKFSDPDLKRIFNTIVHYKKARLPRELFREMVNYPYALLINVPERPGIIPAKTYDYIGMKQTIFLIAPPGALVGYMKNLNQFTAEMNVDSIKEQLLELKTHFLNEETPGLADDIIQLHAYPKATKKLLQYILEPTNNPTEQ